MRSRWCPNGCGKRVFLHESGNRHLKRLSTFKCHKCDGIFTMEQLDIYKNGDNND